MAEGHGTLPSARRVDDTGRKRLSSFVSRGGRNRGSVPRLSPLPYPGQSLDTTELRQEDVDEAKGAAEGHG